MVQSPRRHWLSRLSILSARLLLNLPTLQTPRLMKPILPRPPILLILLIPLQAPRLTRPILPRPPTLLMCVRVRLRQCTMATLASRSLVCSPPAALPKSYPAATAIFMLLATTITPMETVTSSGLSLKMLQLGSTARSGRCTTTPTQWRRLASHGYVSAPLAGRQTVQLQLHWLPIRTTRDLISMSLPIGSIKYSIQLCATTAVAMAPRYFWQRIP